MVVLQHLLVALIGALVGVAELVDRYRDAPASVLMSGSALLYCSLNAIAAIAALTAVQGFDISFGVTDTESLPWVQVFASGFSAMAVLRSSFMMVRINDREIGIGPSSLLQIVLGAADRNVDRMRAEARAEEAATIMEGVSFEKAFPDLSTYCLALMQNLPETEQAQLGRELSALDQADLNEEIKVLTMGLTLMNFVGPDVLKAAVKNLGAIIKDLKPVEDE